MGLISTTALAAHQIALQIAAILFMVPFGIGMAATVRVGHAVGRGDAPAVKRAGLVATSLGIVFMSAMTLVVILGRFAIARFFFGEAAESAGGVIELTATLLMVGATFFVADGIQTVAAGALRGMNDTRIPLLFAVISYWLIGFPAAYGLAFRIGSRRGRRLDRAVLRHGGLCRSAGPAFPAAGRSLLFAEQLTFRGYHDLARRSKLSHSRRLAMQVQTIEPDATAGQLLAGAQFSDAFSVVVDGTALDARLAAEKMLGALAAMDRKTAGLAQSSGIALWFEEACSNRVRRCRYHRDISRHERNPGAALSRA